MRRLTGLLLILFVMVVMAEPGEWVIETVDSEGSVGSWGALALDSSDCPHIMYLDYTNKDLKHAYRDGLVWQTETVDTEGDTGYASSFAIDSSDKLHVSYYDYTNDEIKYAYWNGTIWETETVASGIYWGYKSSLALWGNAPRLAYYDDTSGCLLFAYKDSGIWVTEIVDSYSTNYSFAEISLGLFDQGRPQIAYCSYFQGEYDLNYAHRYTVGDWSILNIDSGDIGGTSMVTYEYHARDWSHIAYYDKFSGDLNYAIYEEQAGYFTLDTIDSEGDVGNYNSIALRHNSYPFMSYYDATNGDLKYAHLSTTFTVDSEGDVGYTTSLAFNSQNMPRISYYDATNDDLKYAWWDPTAGFDDLSLSAEATNEGVLLSWSIVGDTPAAVSVLRSASESLPIALSGELTGTATSWLDVSAEAGVEYAYYLQVTELDGTISRFGPSEVVVPNTVSELTLSDPYPNPASSALTVSYELAIDGKVSLSVYDLSGRLVETLVSGEQTAGRHSVSWDSSTSATGVYLLRLETAGEAITKRTVISR